MNKKYLFVYGTLKKGFRANFLLENEVFISNAKTIDKFCMISSELGSYPILYNNVSNLGKKVYGEIYSVSCDKFEELDSYEDVPNLYKRIWPAFSFFVIKLLLANKADKSLLDNKGKTAFEYAAFSGNEAIINLLK